MKIIKYLAIILIGLLVTISTQYLTRILLSQKPAAVKTTVKKVPIIENGVKLYFSKHPESDNDPQKTFPVARKTTADDLPTFAIQQLLAGPSTSEEKAGYFVGSITLTGNSDCGSGDFTLNALENTSTLRFCRTASLTGIMSDAQLENDIKDTLLQFPGVKKVVILNKDDDCLFNLSGLNLCR
jgi:hypothetical protein